MMTADSAMRRRREKWGKVPYDREVPFSYSGGKKATTKTTFALAQYKSGNPKIMNTMFYDRKPRLEDLLSSSGLLCDVFVTGSSH